jgi:diguanylate cyclase (GGDEF)-like protein
MFDSLRSRLILLLLGLLSLMAVSIGAATLSAMKRDSYSQAEKNLSVAEKVFQQLLANRVKQLADSVRIVSSDFGFRHAVATSEQDTISSVLENHGGRIDANISMLLSLDGQIVASTQPIAASQISSFFQRMKENGQDSDADILLLGDQAYQLVMQPVKAPQIIGWVGMGFVLDRTLALQIKGVTELDISFTAIRQGQPHLLASTLGGEDLSSDLKAQPQQVVDLVLNDSMPPYLNQSVALDQQQQLWALLHLPTQRWRDNYLLARSQILLIFGLGLFLALILAYAVARSITEPLRQLTEFARNIGQGVNTSLPKVHKGEVGLLSQTLNRMQQDLQQREQQLLFQSQYDSLTGLANRSLAEIKLPELLQLQPQQLLLINIKDFKHINDAFGYQNGDLLLQQLAERLQQCQLHPSLVARLGGDEFLLVHQQMMDTHLLLQIQHKLSREFRLGHSGLNLTLAMAVYTTNAVCEPSQSQLSANDALRRVAIAMMHAKQRNDHIAVYQQGQDESHQRELTILHDLPLSLATGQMFVVYQPKVDLASQRCHSAEALIRWQHPVLGFIPPDEFIRLAEHSGLIAQITDWMTEQVLAQLAQWQQQDIRLKVAINLSAHDLTNPQLPVRLAQQLSHYALDAGALALEVTEGAVMQDPQQVIRILTELRLMGIELAIDDFGTGQSSLAYLKQLPVHEVKIDRAFVKDIEHNTNDELIVQATTQLAHGLGLLVTAEGLENLAGLAKLQLHGIDKVQGYFFSKPLPAADFARWLSAFHQQQKR